jgi:hypothetical protein
LSKSTKVFVKDIDKRETLAYMPSRQNCVVGGHKISVLLCKSRDFPVLIYGLKINFSTTKVSKSLGLG